MLERADRLLNTLKPFSFLPAPAGPYEVGYTDLMTPGRPENSSFLRLYYPTDQSHAAVEPARTPIWTEPATKAGFIDFLQAMIEAWPSWVNNNEFALLRPISWLNWASPRAFTSLFSLGWGAVGRNARIPVVHQAQLAEKKRGDKGRAWPTVVFSHGLGCNRYAYSKICYDLASEGFVVAAVEHREGSACHSTFRLPGLVTDIPHRVVRAGENEYEARHGQVVERAAEASRVLDLLYALNAGGEAAFNALENALDTEAGFRLEDLLPPGSLDLSHGAYMMGHSFGGATALLAAARDARFRAVVSLDPWMFPLGRLEFRVTQPVLMINTEGFVHKNSIDKVREACADLSARILAGAVHLVHTDAPLLFTSELMKAGVGMACSKPAEVVLADNHAILHAWLRDRQENRTSKKASEFGIKI